MSSGRIITSKSNSDLNSVEPFESSEQERVISEIVNKVSEDFTHEETKLIIETTTERKVYQEHKKSGKVDFEVYKKYIQAGGIFRFLVVFCVCAIVQLTTSYGDKIISNWVNIEEKIYNYTSSNRTNVTEGTELYRQRSQTLFLFSSMVGVHTLSTIGRGFAVLFFARKASIRLHKRMISSIVNATMQFFDINFIGNILNRLSKDLNTVDETLPSVIYQVFAASLMVVGIIVLITSVNKMFLILAIIFFVLLVILRQYCVRTSRCLKRLDTSTRSPVVGHINATFEGLTTIRAFKSGKILENEFDQHQDLYTSAAFILQSSMRAFAFILECLCGCFIAIIIMSFLVSKNDTSTGNVGLAVTEAFLLSSNLQWIIHVWTDFENQMTSAERVTEYIKIKQENKKGAQFENWPKYGEVNFENVHLSYTNSKEHILKNITFNVTPKEKIGIVGRTGAGKSSIILALFRLYDIEGKISIDGTDITKLSLGFLRSKISIIPQDPVLFSGTIRDNIDPTGIFSDNEIWNSIKTANLERLVPSLDLEISEGGSNFSVGQRQLICLTRAIVRNNKIVVFDEATANMDSETDDLIQQTMKKSFLSCTVFTIAHKLHSVINCDRVMVLNKGEVIEFDTPKRLLQNKKGHFYKMIAKTGLLSTLQ